MATQRNKQKLAAVLGETQESARNRQSQNTFVSGMTERYITQASEEIKSGVTEKLSQEFSRTVTYFGCSVQTWRISSEPASTDMLRNRSGNILQHWLRKPGTH